MRGDFFIPKKDFNKQRFDREWSGLVDEASLELFYAGIKGDSNPEILMKEKCRT